MVLRGGITGMVDVGSRVQSYEVAALLLLVAGAVPVIMALRRYGARWFFLGYASIVGSGVATVLETMVASQVMNGVEHVLNLAAAFLFLFSAYWSRERAAGHPRDWRDVL